MAFNGLLSSITESGPCQDSGPLLWNLGDKGCSHRVSGVPGRPGERLCAELSVGLTRAGASPRPPVESPRLLEPGLPGAPTRQPGDEGPWGRGAPGTCGLECATRLPAPLPVMRPERSHRCWAGELPSLTDRPWPRVC